MTSSPMIAIGVSYDADQYERLRGPNPHLINLFKLKAIARKLRLRTTTASKKNVRDVLSGPLLEESNQELILPEQPSGQRPPDSSSVSPHPRPEGKGPNNCLGLYAIFAHPLCVLLVCVPLGILAPQLQWGSSWTFWLNFMALVPLAKFLGDATEELAACLGNETVSGLLNASFGNAVEMIVAVQAIRENELPIVKASLLGSVLSNILLVLGSAFVLGGLTPSATRHGRNHSFLGSPDAYIGLEKEQKFSTKSALISVALLLFSCMSFALPTMFNHFTSDHAKVLSVSRIGALIVMSTYIAFLTFQLYTHAKTLSRDESDLPVERTQSGEAIFPPADDDVEAEDADAEAPSITASCAVLLMAVCTLVTAVNSELLVGAIQSVVTSAGIPETFIGLILLPIAGNACEHASALRFAMVDRPGLAIGIAVGSSTQVALLVVPFSVLTAYFMGRPLDLDFGPLNVLVVTFSVLVVLTLLLDGRSNWMKGYLLMALYVFIATLYWFLPSGV
mmetsp:Transcript_118213/g.346298  ORF Transcript_118213/g.346298 Transcript_118213/m.346298 type:complete len:506 (+) Transcript_118213:147-1664(+)